MPPELIRLIESPDQVTDYYRIIHKAIGGNVSDGSLWLVKQKDWVAVVAYEGRLYFDENEDRIVQTLANFGYTEFIAVTWTNFSPPFPCYVVPATVDGLGDLTVNTFHWYVWFAGNPDWFILVPKPMDFIIVAGQPDFVRQILGCELDEASIDIREMSESEYLDSVIRKYYVHLLEELQIAYPKAEPGTVINLGLLNWDETPQAL
jgi:hypothetical protein